MGSKEWPFFDLRKRRNEESLEELMIAWIRYDFVVVEDLTGEWPRVDMIYLRCNDVQKFS